MDLEGTVDEWATLLRIPSGSNGRRLLQSPRSEGWHHSFLRGVFVWDVCIEDPTANVIDINLYRPELWDVAGEVSE